MSDRKDRDKTKYSLDEILEEYGSGKYKRHKVLDFPGPEERSLSRQATRRFTIPRQALGEDEGENGAEDQAQRQQRGQAVRKAPKEDDDESIVEIEPATPLHGIAARLSTMMRRAENYADHMYDHAGPDEDGAEIEDEAEEDEEGEEPEEERDRPRKARFAHLLQPDRPRRKKKPRPLPPDRPPAELAAKYAKGRKARRVRTVLSMLCACLCAVASLLDPAALGLAWLTPEHVPLIVVRQALLLGLLALTGALCAEVIGRGIAHLFTLRLWPESLLALAFFMTIADSVALLLTDSREGLPCSAVTAFALAFSLWGDTARRQGDRLSARAASQAREPFAVTLDEGKWEGRPAYAKWPGTQAGFGSQLQAEDCVERAYAVAGPVLLLSCLVCSALAAAAGGGVTRFLWCASATLTAASAWPAALVYSFPWRKLARRLFGVGAALAGWPGVSRCREAGIIMTDNDLFPTGTVQVSAVRVFGNFSNEKVVAYTASLMRVLDCGLTRPFHDLLRAQGSFYRECASLDYREGGVMSVIREQAVCVGTAAFMHSIGVALPQGLNVKHAIFCAIDGELAGIFALRYAMGQAVSPCLSTLMQAGVSPVLATRDPNLGPILMEEKFKLPVERMEFPRVDWRMRLSDADQEHDGTLVALLNREGLGPYCDAVVGGRRLRTAARWGTVLSLASSALGVALTFYLTYMGATSSLTPGNFLLYMAMWLVPTALLNHWANQY